MSEALASMADAYAAGVASDAGVVAFADLCTKKSSSRKALLPRITPLIVSEADLKQVHGNPHEKLRQLQLQVLCRLGQAALRKADPMDKTEKKVLYSILSSMAMKMDSLAMVASNNADDDTQSAFRTFILDTLAHRFQSSLPKTFKWLYRALEITLPNDDKTKKTTPSIVVARTQPSEPNLNADCSISQVLQDRASSTSKDPKASRSLFQEVVLTSNQPKCLPVVPIVHKTVPTPTKHLTFSAGTIDNAPSKSFGPTRHTMVLKTPERPKRPPMKKQLVCVASSPPLRKPTKKRLGTLMSSFK